MTTKYTPGPWKLVYKEPPFVQYAGWWIKADHGAEFPIAFVTKTIGGTKPPQEHNARLIAAAPELLKVAENALKILDRVHSEYGLTDSQLIGYTNLSVIIAKAKSELK